MNKQGPKKIPIEQSKSYNRLYTMNKDSLVRLVIRLRGELESKGERVSDE